MGLGSSAIPKGGPSWEEWELPGERTWPSRGTRDSFGKVWLASAALSHTWPDVLGKGDGTGRLLLGATTAEGRDLSFTQTPGCSERSWSLHLHQLHSPGEPAVDDVVDLQRCLPT